jgi:hypothetical protein
VGVAATVPMMSAATRQLQPEQDAAAEVGAVAAVGLGPSGRGPAAQEGRCRDQGAGDDDRHAGDLDAGRGPVQRCVDRVAQRPRPGPEPARGLGRLGRRRRRRDGREQAGQRRGG